MKKKLIYVFGTLVAVIILIAILPARIDCGNSDIYTIEERELAGQLVANKVKEFDGCKLFLVKYDGDDISQENLDYCNDIAADDTQYVDCIVFTSYFLSPMFRVGAFNPNDLYSWNWFVARTSNGLWEIVSYGYA